MEIRNLDIMAENADAQYVLGHTYYKNKIFDKALSCYVKAAENDHTEAQYNLGLMYRIGRIVDQDFDKAIFWLRKAANKGHEEADYYCYDYDNYYGKPNRFSGWSLETVSQDQYDEAEKHKASDYSEALEWYKKAAENEHAGAQYKLSIMFEKGRGTPKDYELSLEWCTRAAINNQSDAQYKIAMMRREANRNSPIPDLDFDVCLQASYWLLEAAKNSHVDAREALIDEYTDPNSVEVFGFSYDNYCRDIFFDMASIGHDKAIRWVTEEAESGQLQAQMFLGSMYENGRGVRPDYEKAVRLYDDAAKNEYADSSAYCKLALKYIEGKGIPQDYAKAFELLKKVDENNYDAILILADIYKKGMGTAQDYAKAFELYEKVAQAGWYEGQCQLAIMYEEGKGTDQDLVKASEWRRKAADNDIPF